MASIANPPSACATDLSFTCVVNQRIEEQRIVRPAERRKDHWRWCCSTLLLPAHGRIGLVHEGKRFLADGEISGSRQLFGALAVDAVHLVEHLPAADVFDGCYAVFLACRVDDEVVQEFARVRRDRRGHAAIAVRLPASAGKSVRGRIAQSRMMPKLKTGRMPRRCRLAKRIQRRTQVLARRAIAPAAQVVAETAIRQRRRLQAEGVRLRRCLIITPAGVVARRCSTHQLQPQHQRAHRDVSRGGVEMQSEQRHGSGQLPAFGACASVQFTPGMAVCS